jgi:tripartite-type tricarboxylate transporter receptor subunit TctC
MPASSCVGRSPLLRNILSAAVAIAAFASAYAVESANAQQSVADFYRGKQIRFIIRSEPGGGYDLYSRLLGTYLVKHIPGDPTLIPQNMPGGGGIQSANYMAEIAPRDGTYLTMIGDALPLDQSLGFTPSFKANLGSFGWIGNVSSSNFLIYTWHTSPVKTMADAEKIAVKMGATGAGSPSSWFPALFNKLFGTKFEIVNGYKGGAEVKLAMERGEVEGYANPWTALISATPDLMRDRLISILVQAGVHREKELPDVPLLTDLARSADDRIILDFVSKTVSIGRPVGTTPGVPADRLAALRKAFDDTLVDPAFLAEAAREGAEIAPMDGATLQKVLEDVMDAPQDIKDEVKAALPDRS